jgi:hypothetical protein
VKKLQGAHQFLNGIVCDRCGFKTIGLDRISRTAMSQHIKAKHALLTTAEEIAEAEELAAVDLPDRCAYHGGEGDGGVFCDECREDQAAAAGRRAGR